MGICNPIVGDAELICIPFDEENVISAFGKFDGCDIADFDEEDGMSVVRVQLNYN